MNAFRICAVVACIAVLQSHAIAQRTFEVSITHDQEPGIPGITPLVTSGPNPMPRPLSFGHAVFTLNAAMTSLSFVANIFNIDVTGLQTPNDTNDNLTNAHIHAGPVLGGPGTNAGVVFGFFGTPFNDNNPNDATMTPFSSGVGGTFSAKWDLAEGNNTTLAAQLANIFAGRAYINFHTNQFTGGEIRGQLNVPETGSTVLLLAIAACGLVAIRARTNRSRV